MAQIPRWQRTLKRLRWFDLFYLPGYAIPPAAGLWTFLRWITPAMPRMHGALLLLGIAIASLLPAVAWLLLIARIDPHSYKPRSRSA